MKRSAADSNVDSDVVEGFGTEWQRFDNSALDEAELRAMFDSYFGRFPWSALPSGAVGMDAGCGSGRWARLVAPRVGHLHCVDASSAALEVTRQILRAFDNCSFHYASVAEIPLPNDSLDFGYSLGVLHHVPDTAAGLRSCVAKLKPGAPFLLYLYYALETRPAWYRVLWRLAEAPRIVVSRLPTGLRHITTAIIAMFVYWPLARFAALVERVGMRPEGLPLSTYRRRSFYVMRNDALDRFGTRLEQRFTRSQIQTMMELAGLERIEFSPKEPYWCAVGYRKEA